VAGDLQPDEEVAARGALAVHSACAEVTRAFDDITRRAQGRWELRDWAGMQADALQRLELTPRLINQAVEQLGTLLGAQRDDHAFWRATHDAYARLITGTANPEVAQTFFNSVSRRLLGTVGLAEDIDFFTSEPAATDGPVDAGILRRYAWSDDLPALLAAILDDMEVAASWRDREADIRRVAAVIRQALAARGEPAPDAVEMLRPIFFRNKGAYLVGRICRGSHHAPFVLPLIHPPAGVGLDTALLDEDLVSIVFSFARSYFHVAADQPSQEIAFLKSILPLKPVEELYIAIGHHKHGKTEMYRSLRRHLEASDDRFITAPGSRGMVMLVFTLPSYDIVFKVIRDRFDRPKTSNRRQVMPAPGHGALSPGVSPGQGRTPGGRPGVHPPASSAGPVRRRAAGGPAGQCGPHHPPGWR